MMSSYLITISTTAVVVIVIIVALAFTATTPAAAQHLVRSMSSLSSLRVIALTPIASREILPLSSTSTANVFTVSSAALVHAVSFLFDQELSQIPFTCGGAQVNCRRVKCYLTCANATYSVALRCDDAGAPAAVSWRLVALSQETVESFDDQFAVTLRVQQRLAAGTRCHFAFANELFGRTTVAGRLKGSVVVHVARALPLGSGVPFHPDPATWNNSAAISTATTTPSFATAYVRCSADGTVTHVTTPQMIADAAAPNNWTGACCYGSSANSGDCTVQYSDQPAYFDAATQKSVWAQSNAMVASSSTLASPAGAPAACGGTTQARALRANASVVTAAGFATSTALGRSLFALVQLAGGIGIFLCHDTASTAIEYVCAAYAANSSVVAFAPAGFVLTAASPIYAPICEAVNERLSPVGPFDAPSPQLLPPGPCFAITAPAQCRAPCLWSREWSVCMWADTAFVASSTAQQRSAPCQWPVPNASTLSVDLRCRLAQSELSLAALLAHLCVKRAGLTGADVPWCIQSAFTCGGGDASAEVVVDRLMSFYCDSSSALPPSVAGCADPNMQCVPNGTTLAPPPQPAFVLNVITNRSVIHVDRQRGGFVSVAIFLIASGAKFNLSAIRHDLADVSRGHPGFEPVVPAGSSNGGRFSLAAKLPTLFPDATFAVTDLWETGAAARDNASNTNNILTDSLVLRIKLSDAFQPLPGTTQYLDIRPPRTEWMAPAHFTFQRVRIAFAMPAAESCSSLTALSAVTAVLGLLSGFGGWLNVAALQGTLVSAQSTCAPEPVRRCFLGSAGIVSPAVWIWGDESDAGGIVDEENNNQRERRTFWTQFFIVMVPLLLHYALLRGYKYCAPLQGSAEQTLWFPAPAFYLSGLLAVGTVRAAWLVVFTDEFAALRVLSFFCFATLIGIILPWWFLKLFRREENFFLRYRWEGFFFLMLEENADEDEGEENEKQRSINDPSSPASLAETAHISLRRNQEHNRDSKTASDLLHTRRTSRDKIAHFFFSLFLPTGCWPHTRGMAPARDLLHADGTAVFFSWVSLLLLGLAGLNFAYSGVDDELCKTNFANMAVLQAVWIAAALWWRPFRVPILTALWVLARVLDFADAIKAAQWVAAGRPDGATALEIRRIKVASVCFMLVFGVVTFLVKLRENIHILSQRSESLVQRQADETTLNSRLRRLDWAGASAAAEGSSTTAAARAAIADADADLIVSLSGSQRQQHVGPVAVLRAPPTTIASSLEMELLSSSSRQQQQNQQPDQKRRIEVRWDDYSSSTYNNNNNNNNNNSADASFMETTPRQRAARSQAVANMLSVFPSLLRVEELIGTSLRLVATFGDVGDACAAVQALSERIDETGTRIVCRLLHE